MSVMDWISGRVFKMVHGNNLVYNTCWEDPRLDRVALDLGPDDNVLVITSAGCNSLDYALTSPNAVHAVDMNPRQNALLELKKSAIKNLEFDDFFQMFGRGYIEGARPLYKDVLRDDLGEWSQKYWDKRIKFFTKPKRTFYYRGTSGTFAKMVRSYMEKVIRIRPQIEAVLEAKSIEEQTEIYNNQIRDRLWSRSVRFAMNRDTTLSMLGVPKAQRRQIETQYEGGIVKFVQDCVESVFTKLPISDNYFWRVYMTGSYTPDCCPEYLKPDNFQALKNGLADRIHVHTNSVQGFLEQFDGKITRFVLLDHMDWLSDKYFSLLESEWQAILDRAGENSRVIWRSGGLRTEYINDVKVKHNGQTKSLPELLNYNEQLATELHELDRVHTYGSFYIADVAA